jgi:D-erythro-7,8-dihydroneopterin triphosphate epimerase
MKAKRFQSGIPGPSTKATINIRNLRLRTFIGFNPEEMEKQQDVVINIEINYRIADSVLEDQVDQALNYKTVAKKVIHLVENGRFLLLEKLVADVLEICSESPEVIESRVTIDKPHALRFADSVSLTLEYRREEARQLRHLEKVS